MLKYVCYNYADIRYLGMRLFPGYLVTWLATRTICKYNVIYERSS